MIETTGTALIAGGVADGVELGVADADGVLEGVALADGVLLAVWEGVALDVLDGVLEAL